jgi:hypothetical protein
MSRRGDQHPFTPEPREPEPWPAEPGAGPWAPEEGSIPAVDGPTTEVLAASDLKRIKNWEARQRRKYRKRGFSIGFGSIEPKS